MYGCKIWVWFHSKIHNKVKQISKIARHHIGTRPWYALSMLSDCGLARVPREHRWIQTQDSLTAKQQYY